MKSRTVSLALTLMFAGLAKTTHAQADRAVEMTVDSPSQDSSDTRSGIGTNARAESVTHDYNATEKDLNATAEETAPAGKEAVIETSHPYLLPRLFTLPTRKDRTALVGAGPDGGR